MNRLQLVLAVILMGAFGLAEAQSTKSIESPDGRLKFSFTLEKKAPAYGIAFKGKWLVRNSPISLELEDGLIRDGLTLVNTQNRDGAEDYELIVGKTKTVHHPYRELLVDLREKSNPHHALQIQVRAFNDGIAFRYLFPKQDQLKTLNLLDENTAINLVGNPMVHTLMLPNFTSSHEGYYSHLLFDQIRNDTLMDMPTLFEFPGNIYLAVTEAALRDYAGMYLVKRDGLMQSQLSPLPGEGKMKVKASLPHQSPWRVFLVSDRVGALIESNILTSLNETCKIRDLSWIHPGKCSFPWWNGNVVPDSNFAPGNNFETNKYYIDFCASNHIEYHSVVEYGLHEWYTNDGYGFQPGKHVDVTKPMPGLNMKMICDYAREKGVGIRVWVHWAALYPQLDSAFAVFEKWGLQGMMVDFMDRDDQVMVNIQEEILQKAAAHHLHIQFHGAYKPTGMNRTYPNEFTREGTLNYETNKWDEQGLSPDHDIIMPFTRMLAGATDYHLGGFRAVTPDKFKTQYTRPLMVGTRCHMLAMYVVLESYLGMVCDYPQAYQGQPGFEFIQGIPTTWDETRVIDAKVNEFVTIARKKNGEWWVGSITNSSPREISIPLNFLEDGGYRAELYTDADDTGRDPNHLRKEIKEVTKSDVLKLKLAAGGGQALHLFKK